MNISTFAKMEELERSCFKIKLELEIFLTLKELHPMRYGDSGWIKCTTFKSNNGGTYMCYHMLDSNLIHYRRIDTRHYPNEFFEVNL
jgi:hypothetical protein